jgi:enterochelin esterase family protein
MPLPVTASLDETRSSRETAPLSAFALVNRVFVVSVVSLLITLASAADAPKPATDRYVIGPDSKPQEGVPKGTVTKHQIVSQVYPTTTFTYQLYVPAQYDGTKPACVFVGQDGNNFVREPGAWHVPVVFDNLIAKKEMPLTIGIFIDPSSQQQRAMQYDTLSDRYARFVIDEVLPEVGKTYKLTSDPEGRAIGGFSSGAICAFTVAWERPDAFRKVASFFGSYTSIAFRPAQGDRPMQPGGDLYPTLIRRSPIKPLRIFFQDGSNDLNNSFGNWYLANLQMVSALEWANANADQRKAPGPRYAVEHAWGDGGHTANHGGSIFPDVMRWLFQGYEPKE